MPSELERRLARALAAAPGPGPDVSERAERSALDALSEPPSPRRWSRPVLVAAAAALLLVSAGVTLAATGAHPFGDRAPRTGHAPAPNRLPERPAGAPGTLATFAGGRIWMGHVRGRKATAVELSPGALYAAVGEAHRLAVYTPDLHRLVWAHAVPGTVVAIAWRPIGTQIAYIVRTGRRYELRLIDGLGRHDGVVDPHVAPALPSWRWDSQGLAYIGAGGRIVVRDLAHRRSTVVRGSRRCPAGRVTSVSFGPQGRRRDWLAGASTGGNAYAVDTATGHVQCIGGPPLLIGLLAPPIVRWTPAGDILLAHAQYIDRLRIVHGRVRSLDREAHMTAALGVADLGVSRDGRTMVVALIGDHVLHEVVARLPPLRSRASLTPIRTLRSIPVPAPANIHATLIWR